MAVFLGVAFASAIGWVLSLFFPRSAARRHLILTSALAACLLTPVVAAVRSTSWTLLAIRRPAASSEPVPTAPAPSSAERRVESIVEPNAPTAADASTLHPMGGERATAPPNATTIATTSADRASVAGAPRATAINAAIAIYFMVAGVMLLRLLLGVAAVLRIKRHAAAVDVGACGVPVFEADVAIPLAVGLGRPAIVLPRDFRAAFSPQDLRRVLAHEAEHLKRRDHWIMLLQQLTAALYWPIVTVHLLNRALIRAREELCDNAVIAGSDPAAYSRTLLAVAERAVGRRPWGMHLAPSAVWRGDLERRVAGLLDARRDRRTRTNPRASWTAAAALLVAAVLLGTTRRVAVAEESTAPATEAAPPQATASPTPPDEIAWTGIPKVDLENPALHRGVVLAPDGTPLAGASIHAASTIELLEMADAEEVGVKDLGRVRAVTDADGRFQFNAEDLTWVTPSGERKRWETLLVATKADLPPGWLKTWGADRSLRDHWHPRHDRDVAIRTRPAATLTGRLLLAGGEPLGGAHVRLTGLMAPVEYDLDIHVPQEEVAPLGMFATVDYEETLYRPWLLPGLNTEAATDDDGHFELPNLPEGFIANIEVTHPTAVTTNLRVAIRAIEPVYRKPSLGNGEPALTLRGSGFTAELPKGAILRGRVEVASGMGGEAAPGVIVALANHNSSDGMSGQQFKTDADGRFEVTGLPPRPEGFELAFAGSFAAPYTSRRQTVVPGEDADVRLNPAAAYRLTLVDPHGQPVDREVYSIEVQVVPGVVRRDIKTTFNDARRVAPGVYEGIVPIGPGAVLVKRGAKTDRPAAVDPKAFFAPGRSDWTLEEERFAYGDVWQIARSAVVTTERLRGENPTTDQLEFAAIVLTDAQSKEGVLELTATIHSDPPVNVTLVDEAGDPVHGARVKRQLKRYEGEDLPATFEVYGLHPDRAEFLAFTHDRRGLVGTLSTTWTGEPIRVVMRPAATLIGRITDATGTPNFDFGIRVTGQGVMPDTFLGGRMYELTDRPGEQHGQFRLEVSPGLELHGEFVRKTPDHRTRPSTGVAFGPLTPEPGETVNLGDLVIP